jgi:chromate reductase
LIHILGLSGSLRTGSYNTKLLHAAAALAPDGARIEPAFIHGIPLYDADVEAQGIPEPVQALKERIVAAHGLLVVTPEYNNSVPGVLKNAIDWLSRPGSDIPRVFGGRAVGLIGASPGLRGTVLSQTAWLPVLRVLGTRPYFGHVLYVAHAADAFDGDGGLVADDVRERLRRYLEGFVAHVAMGVKA